MSVIIDNVEIIRNVNFRIAKGEFYELAERYPDCCEGNLFNQVEENRDIELKDDNCFYFDSIDWYGEGSGRSMDILMDKILPKFEGEADLLFKFDCGSLEGYRVQNGLVRHMRAEIRLVDDYNHVHNEARELLKLLEVPLGSATVLVTYPDAEFIVEHERGVRPKQFSHFGGYHVKYAERLKPAIG